MGASGTVAGVKLLAEVSREYTVLFLQISLIVWAIPFDIPESIKGDEVDAAVM